MKFYYLKISDYRDWNKVTKRLVNIPVNKSFNFLFESYDYVGFYVGSKSYNNLELYYKMYFIFGQGDIIKCNVDELIEYYNSYKMGLM